MCDHAKVVIIVLNVLTAILSLAAGILGAELASNSTGLITLLLGIDASLTGFFAFGASFLGFAGAALENRRLLITYICLTSLIVLNEFAGAIVFVVYGNPFLILAENAESMISGRTPGTGSPKDSSDRLTRISETIGLILFFGVVLKGIAIGFAGYMWNEIRKRDAPPANVVVLKVN